VCPFDDNALVSCVSFCARKDIEVIYKFMYHNHCDAAYSENQSNSEAFPWHRKETEVETI
jgi:hypothetical protein